MVDYPKYLKRLLLSLALALLTLFIAFGLMFFVKNPMIPGEYILLVFALFFILFTVFYESRAKGKGKAKSKTKTENQIGEGLKPLIRGVFLGICATFALVTIYGGLRLTLEQGFAVGGKLLISALAIAMIVSMVYLSLLRPSSTS
jgi:small basic protein